MSEKMKKFLEMVSKDEALAKKYSDASREEIVKAAKELGIELTDADFNQPLELSDDEPDVVAGGSRCICSFGGGGKASEGEKTCACVMGGGGEFKNGDVRCACTVGGDGNR